MLTGNASLIGCRPVTTQDGKSNGNCDGGRKYGDKVQPLRGQEDYGKGRCGSNDGDFPSLAPNWRLRSKEELGYCFFPLIQTPTCDALDRWHFVPIPHAEPLSLPKILGNLGSPIRKPLFSPYRLNRKGRLPGRFQRVCQLGIVNVIVPWIRFFPALVPAGSNELRYGYLWFRGTRVIALQLPG